LYSIGGQLPGGTQQVRTVGRRDGEGDIFGKACATVEGDGVCGEDFVNRAESLIQIGQAALAKPRRQVQAQPVELLPWKFLTLHGANNKKRADRCPPFFNEPLSLWGDFCVPAELLI
jgi:hypothetical protein